MNRAVLRNNVLRVLQALVFVLFIVRVASLQATANWLPDLSTHFLFQYFVAALLLSLAFLILKSWRFSFFAAAIALVSLAQLYSATDRVAALSAKPVFTIAQFNTLFRNTDHAALLAWLHANAGRFDVVALHEATPGLAKALDAAQADYPYRIGEPRDNASGMILLSRIPFQAEKLRVQTPLFLTYILHVTLQPPGLKHPVSLYAMHAMTPIQGKYQNVRTVELAALTDAVTHDHTPHIVIEGDWNLTPYSPYFQRVQHATGLREQRLALLPLPTWPSWGIPWLTRIPIDHILTDDGLRLVAQSIGPALGSDHLPLIDGFIETGVRTRK